jgi:antitoxin (DNA-binding transcriptional repressor) of toxin-antitoxin stability system
MSSEIDKVTTSDYYGFMKAVGVKVLKAKLSEYLRLVKSGEVVLVTERDEVIAELRPAHHQRLPAQDFAQGLESWAELRQVTLRASESGELVSPEEISKMPGVSSKEVLDRQRKDSR